MCAAGRLPRGNLPAGGLKSRYCYRKIRLPVQDAEPRKFLAFEVFQAGAAAGGNVPELVIREPERADCGGGIAATHYRERAGFREGLGDGAGAGREGFEFEDTHGAVPED